MLQQDPWHPSSARTLDPWAGTEGQGNPYVVGRSKKKKRERKTNLSKLPICIYIHTHTHIYTCMYIFLPLGVHPWHMEVPRLGV